MKQIAQTIQEAFNKVDEMYLLGGFRLDEIETELNNIQHEIELIEFNPFTSFKVMKRYQELRRERRELKNDMHLSDVILKQFGGREKVMYRTEAMDAKVKSSVNRQDNCVKDTGVIRGILKGK